MQKQTKSNYMEQKKPTNAQLQRRIARAVVHLDRTKNTQEIYWSDKGLRLVSDNDYCVIETGFHRHIFSNLTSAGISRPWLYTKRIVEIANEHLEDCKTENGYSFTKLLEFLKDKKDKTEYNICVFADWWYYNLFQPLYSIGESEVEQFLVYESYIHNIARNSVLLSEKTDGMTNKEFLSKVAEEEDKFLEDMEERVLFEKKTDEEVARENIEAIQEQELNEQTKR